LFHENTENVSWMLPCHYPKGYIISSEGERCDYIGYVITGSLALIHYNNNGEMSTLNIIKAGETFGEVLILSNTPFYIGHLIAQADTKVSYLARKDLQAAINHDKQFRDAFIETLSDKAQNIFTSNKVLQQPSLREKIIMHLEQQMRIQQTDHITIQSIQTLATQLNVQRPSLSRTMNALIKEGLIIRSNKTYALNNKTCQI